MRKLTSLLLALFVLTLSLLTQAQTTPTAEDYLKTAREKQSKRDVGGAIADYTRAIELKPDLAEAFLERGKLQESQANHNAALADYSKAIQLDPSMARAYEARANVRLARGFDPEGAIADYDRLIALGWELENSFYQRGAAKVRLGDLDGAIADFSVVIDLPSPEAENFKPVSHKHVAYLARAMARQAKGDLPGALSDYDAAIEAEPRVPYSYIDRALLLEKMGQAEKARADYEKAVEIDAGVAKHIREGVSDRVEKARESAKAKEDSRLNSQPRTAREYFARGTTFLMHKDYDDAIADFDKAIELDPKQQSAYHNRGNAHMSKGEFEKAIADFTKVIDLAPLEEPGYNGRAIARRGAGDLEGAVTDFTQAIERSPKAGFLYGSRGNVLLLLDRNAEARRDFDECRRLNFCSPGWIDERIKQAKEQRTAGGRQ